MQLMSSFFEDFRQAIEPVTRRKEEAQKADDPVREHLEYHESFSDRHITTFLYGSYKRATAIGDIKDVDIVVVTNYTTSDDPIEVLDDLKDALGELYEKPDLADQRRSIRVDRPLPDVPGSELTLDIIPAIYQDGDDPYGPLWVPDRDKKCWVPTNPQGHIAYSSDLNAHSFQGVAFVRLVKMMKWWWKYQFEMYKPRTASHKRKPKGFWIEVMTGEFADLTKQSYPELIVPLLEKAFNSFRSFRITGQLPELPDPGLRYFYDPTYQTIKTSMTEEEFTFFLNILEESLDWAKRALYASSEREASEYWQKFFGDSFKLAPVEKAASLLSPAVTPGGLSFPNRPILPRKPGSFA